MWLWLEPGAKFIIFQEEAAFLKPENHPSVEQVLAATKSDATLANVPKTLCFPLLLSSRSKGKFCAIQVDLKMHHFLTSNWTVFACAVLEVEQRKS